ncbi:predicted protein [Scheffersomyces stipitis CBS 6054]|uniref:Domain of unknown function at the cortex 1 domain-containing protein n=1 Tax=Scheffersomyces stipitis (strain ATCC 58785 / CBS 6054 / NBRC 10063 / NRRL Y-11545) TaxID=322104 RepID=A3M0D1_PICST|nr:predicted protein [Scheffersomyces stipitis CBS 6054]ABN68500.1 predicted protein [Scheffersomyces stipitis CBS 6054]KAG2730842.1 hypothetical protein G9P44_005991 [Scheffersomyces stipitis]
MTVVRRLLIRAANNYDKDFKVVPINTNTPVEIDSDIGVFQVYVNTKKFDGSKPHLDNSLYELGDNVYLNGEPVDADVTDADELTKLVNSNMRINIKFTPKVPIKGSELIFGNDFTVPIRNHVPTTLLSTGLKFFQWFVNKTVRGDIYDDEPYLYGLALNSFTYLAVDTDGEPTQRLSGPASYLAHKPLMEFINYIENLNDNPDNTLKIPTTSNARRKFFLDVDNCDAFVFNEGTTYNLQFDTRFLKMEDSQYAVSIPTFGSKTFDVNVNNYANEHLNNFNFTVKQNGYEGVRYGTYGLVINFALLDEEGQ